MASSTKLEVIMYYNARRGLSMQSHRQHAHKFGEVWKCVPEMIMDRHTDLQTPLCCIDPIFNSLLNLIIAHRNAYKHILF